MYWFCAGGYIPDLKFPPSSSAAWRGAPDGVATLKVRKGAFDRFESYGEKKKPIKKNHIKEFGGRRPRRRPRDKLGTSQGHLGHLGLIYV